MNFSRAVRMQLIALDLVEGIVDGMREANPSDTVVDQILRRLKRRQDKARRELIQVDDQNRMVFPGLKEHRKYGRDLGAVMQRFRSLWLEETMDGREYVNAVLLYLEEIHQGASRLKVILGEIIDDLSALYELMDPDLSAEETMRIGQEAGLKLVRAMT